MKISLPELSLVLLIGPSGAGKTTFAQKQFKKTEVISSEFCRAIISDDKNNKEYPKDAFDVLHLIIAKRLKIGKFTVVDATNLRSESRRALMGLARKYHFIPIAIVFDIPEEECIERNENRPNEEKLDPQMIHRQCQQLRYSIKNLRREGYCSLYRLGSKEQIDETIVEQQRLWINLKDEVGPFDIIGDIHGCYDELELLLEKLGYEVNKSQDEKDQTIYQVTNPPGRKLVFLGDLVDRGPKIVEVLDLVMTLVKSGQALMVPGNHEKKLARKLKGKEVQLSYGLMESLRQLKQKPSEFTEKVIPFIDHLVSHYVLDEGKLVVAHAGLKESMHGRSSPEVRSFAMYGEVVKGRGNYKGRQPRSSWNYEYRGKAAVVYGHTPVAEPYWHNRTISLDTGCVFGGKLSALRYPEKEVVSVIALKTYCFPPRKFVIQLQKNASRKGIPFVQPEPASPRNQNKTEDYEEYQETSQQNVTTEKATNFRSSPHYEEDDSENFAEYAVDSHSFIEETEDYAASEEKSAPKENNSSSNTESAPYRIEAESLSPNEIEPEKLRPSQREEGEGREENESKNDSKNESESEGEEVFDIEDILGKRYIKTRFFHNIFIREESSIAALEVLNRFTVSPEWLIYLPPKVSPCATSRNQDYLEHPYDAFTYYQRLGIPKLICQEKHIGSRVVFVLCRNEEAAKKRFGVTSNDFGICYSRIGVRFFNDRKVEKQVLTHLQNIFNQANFWEEQKTDWVCFEGVILPRNINKTSLFPQQFTHRSYASQFTYNQVLTSLNQAQEQGARVQGLMKYYQERSEMVDTFTNTYKRYFWDVGSINDIKIAPFHLMATEKGVHFEKEHLWHLAEIKKLGEAEEKLEANLRLLKQTPAFTVDLSDENSQKEAIEWWEDGINQGKAGIILKPSTFVPKGNHWKIQPALKCRGPEYLSLVYGPEYMLQKNLKRLRFRNLSAIRILALKEFSLGIEALERFVEGHSQGAIHECVAGILALESEPLSLCL